MTPEEFRKWVRERARESWDRHFKGSLFYLDCPDGALYRSYWGGRLDAYAETLERLKEVQGELPKEVASTLSRQVELERPEIQH